MKKSKILVATVLATSLFLSSCIGSFSLTKKMWAWNGGLGDKFINEIVFLAFHIIPVYEIVYLGDIIIFNSIDFWGGSNPVASTEVKRVEGENGTYLVEHNANGYKITNETENKSVDLLFDKESNTWSVSNGEQTEKFMTMLENNNVVLYTGEQSMVVSLDENGLNAVQDAINGTLMAAK